MRKLAVMLVALAAVSVTVNAQERWDLTGARVSVRFDAAALSGARILGPIAQ